MKHKKTITPGKNKPIRCQSTPVFLTQQEIERIQKGYNPDREKLLLQAKNRLIQLKQSVLTLEQELTALFAELDQL